jgi:hypothetical protein
LLGHGRWFSPGTPASSTTKTGRHDIAEILLKVALKHKKAINQSINQSLSSKHDRKPRQMFSFIPVCKARAQKIIFTAMYVYFLYNTRTIITKYFLSHFELINSLLNIDLKKKIKLYINYPSVITW